MEPIAVDTPVKLPAVAAPKPAPSLLPAVAVTPPKPAPEPKPPTPAPPAGMAMVLDRVATHTGFKPTKRQALIAAAAAGSLVLGITCVKMLWPSSTAPKPDQPPTQALAPEPTQPKAPPPPANDTPLPPPPKDPPTPSRPAFTISIPDAPPIYVPNNYWPNQYPLRQFDLSPTEHELTLRAYTLGTGPRPVAPMIRELGFEYLPGELMAAALWRTGLIYRPFKPDFSSTIIMAGGTPLPPPSASLDPRLADPSVKPAGGFPPVEPSVYIPMIPSAPGNVVPAAGIDLLPKPPAGAPMTPALPATPPGPGSGPAAPTIPPAGPASSAFPPVGPSLDVPKPPDSLLPPVGPASLAPIPAAPGGSPMLPTVPTVGMPSVTPDPTRKVAGEPIYPTMPPNAIAPPVGPAPLPPSVAPTPPASPKLDYTKPPGTTIPVPGGVSPDVRPTGVSERPPQTSFDVDLYEPRAGDSYQSISRDFYNDTRYSRALSAYNSNKALPGGHVEVPPIYVLQKRYPQLIAAGADPVPSPPPADPLPKPAPVSPPPAPITPVDAKAPAPAPVFAPSGKKDDAPVFRTSGAKTYLVKTTGMTLKTVARETLGSEQRWADLYQLNPQLTAPADYLAIGTEVKLPPEAKLPE